MSAHTSRASGFEVVNARGRSAFGHSVQSWSNAALLDHEALQLCVAAFFVDAIVHLASIDHRGFNLKSTSTIDGGPGQRPALRKLAHQERVSK